MSFFLMIIIIFEYYISYVHTILNTLYSHIKSFRKEKHSQIHEQIRIIKNSVNLTLLFSLHQISDPDQQTEAWWEREILENNSGEFRDTKQYYKVNNNNDYKFYSLSLS